MSRIRCRSSLHQMFVIHDTRSLTAGEEFLKQKQSPVSALFPAAELELSMFRRMQYSSAEGVRRLAEFAKSIPGFVELELSDQITMLKYCAFEVNIVRLSHLTNKDGVLMAEGHIFMTREFLKSLRKPFCDMMETKFDFLAKFRALELEDCDLALFIAALILCGGKKKCNFNISCVFLCYRTSQKPVRLCSSFCYSSCEHPLHHQPVREA